MPEILLVDGYLKLILLRHLDLRLHADDSNIHPCLNSKT